jgi:Rod binding domain-containing protein
MSGRIAATSPIAAPTATAASAKDATTAEAKKKRGLVEAGREFEAIFVRSMLKESPLAKKGDSYGDMAIDAVAKSITAGKGLGLSELIRRSVETSENRSHAEQKAIAPLKDRT